VALIASITTVHLVTEGATCDAPLRELLLTLLAIALAHFVLLIILQFLSLLCQTRIVIEAAKWVYLVANCLIGLAIVTWVVVGSFLLFTNERCTEEFPEAQALGMVVVVFYFTTVALSLCISCVFLVTWFVGAGLMKKAEYKYN
jgi:hypothetical protein